MFQPIFNFNSKTMNNNNINIILYKETSIYEIEYKFEFIVDLKNRNVINQEEYESKKKELLKKI